jgi:hypothetical protein
MDWTYGLCCGPLLLVSWTNEKDAVLDHAGLLGLHSRRPPNDGRINKLVISNIHVRCIHSSECTTETTTRRPPPSIRPRHAMLHRVVFRLLENLWP